METKFFEIREGRKSIPVIATLVIPLEETDADRRVLHEASMRYRSVIFTRLDVRHTGKQSYDWYDMTVRTAHDYILKNWVCHNSGDVIDVDYIVGKNLTSQKVCA